MIEKICNIRQGERIAPKMSTLATIRFYKLLLLIIIRINMIFSYN